MCKEGKFSEIQFWRDRIKVKSSEDQEDIGSNNTHDGQEPKPKQKSGRNNESGTRESGTSQESLKSKHMWGLRQPNLKFSKVTKVGRKRRNSKSREIVSNNILNPSVTAKAEFISRDIRYYFTKDESQYDKNTHKRESKTGSGVDINQDTKLGTKLQAIS